MSRRSVRLAKKADVDVALAPADTGEQPVEALAVSAASASLAAELLNGALTSTSHGAKKRKRTSSGPSRADQDAVKYTVQIAESDEEGNGGDGESGSARKKRRLSPKPLSQLEAMLEEFDLEVRTRCDQMESQTEKLVIALRNALHVELMKIPAKVRAMPMAEFTERYAGSVHAVAGESVQRLIDTLAAAPLTVRKDREPLATLVAGTPGSHALGRALGAVGGASSLFGLNTASLLATPQTYARRAHAAGTLGGQSTIKRRDMMQKAAGSATVRKSVAPSMTSGLGTAALAKPTPAVPGQAAGQAAKHASHASAAAAAAAAAFDFEAPATAPAAAAAPAATNTSTSAPPPRGGLAPSTTKKRGGVKAAAAAVPASAIKTDRAGRLALTLDNGTELALDSPRARKALAGNASMKAQALSRIQEMASQLASIASQLQAGGSPMVV